ncbi:hypothetical protein IC006_2293 [Sulfuracidifex tepidarius]|uniref:Uncharacterized protein n=1 Tax=Sulfuracidifex tepidarius TaxID=1294262 RepID=A0A510DXQ8_9CREN|nr:hypothetical protein [Sulfuracidifex tepidarius]BBG24959.1 hypothetical protein IC006_2293 [Sulfuracidifex tepidarius]
MEIDKDSSNAMVLLVIIASLILSYKVGEEFPALLIVTSLIGILRRKWISVAVVLSSLTFLSFDAITPLDFVLVALSTSVSLVWEVSYSLWLTLGYSALLLGIPSLFQLLALISLLIAMRYFKLEVRGFALSGILLLIVSVFKTPSIADVSYFDLLTGVIGVASENVKLPKRSPYLIPIIPALLFAAYGIPGKFYWADSGSFLFKYSPFSLWLPGSFYYPRVNDFLLFFLFDKPFYLVVFSMVYISGVLSYHALKSMNMKYPMIGSLLYTIMFPIDSPHVVIPYVVLPAILLLSRIRSQRGFLASSMPLVAISSTSPLFPFAAYAMSLLGRDDNASKYSILPYLGVSAFWIIPYMFLGFPNSSSSQWGYLFLLAGVAVISIYLGGRKIAPFVLLASTAVMMLHVPYSSGLYPVIVLTSLYIVMTLDHPFEKVLLGFTFILLLLSQADYIYSAGQAPSLHVPELTHGYVYWIGNYSLLSPLPLTNEKYANYVINVSSDHLNVTRIKGESPYFQELEVNYSSPISLLPEESSLKEYLGYAIWYTDNSSVLVVSYADFPSAKWTVVHSNESVNVDVQYQNGTFESFTSQVLNLTSHISFLEITHEGKSTINISVDVWNGTNLLEVGHLVQELNYSVKPELSGVKIEIHSSYPFTLKLSNASGLSFYLNEHELSSKKAYTMSGKVTLKGIFPGQVYLYVGLAISLLSYLSILLPWGRIKKVIDSKSKKLENLEK